MNTKTCLLVLGMHRSGTSAFTRLLSLVGAQIPKSLLQARGGNETGHWESEKIVQYNDDFLQEQNSKWDDWASLDIELVTRQKRENFDGDVSALLKYEYNGAKLIAIKDPRICRFAELYAQAIINAGYDVKIINVIRNPLETSASLAKRNKMPTVNASLLWLRHVLDAEFQSRAYTRSFVTYDGFLNDHNACLKDVASNLNLEWPHTPDSIKSAAKEFLKDSYKHHNSSIEKVLLDPVLRTWVGETYAILRRAQIQTLSKTDKEKLDQIRKSFDAASPLLHVLTQEIETIKSSQLDVNEKFKSKFDKLTDEQKTTQTHTNLLTTKNENLSSELAHTLGDIEKLNTTIEEQNQAQAHLTQALEDNKKESIGDIERLNTTIEEQNQAQAHLTQALEDNKKESVALNQEHNKLKNKSDTLIDKVSDLSTQLKKSKIRFEQADGEAGQLAKSLELKGKDYVKVCDKLQAALQASEDFEHKYKNEKKSKALLNKIHKKQHAEFAKKETDFQSTLNASNVHVWELEQKLTFEISHNQLKQGNLDEVLNSTSWKAMAIPRKLIRGWRRKTPILVGLLAGKSARHALKSNDNVGEMAANAQSKSTVAARRDLARNRSTTLNADWFKAEVGLKICSNDDLPNITISAVTYNSEKWLPGFFAAVEALDYPHGKISIHFVDNGSGDNTVTLLKDFVQKISASFNTLHVFQRPNEGYGAGNDYGIRQSNDDFVLVTNVDTEFYTDSLRKAVNIAMHDDAKTACWEYRQTPYEHPKYYDPITHLTNWTSHACVLIRRAAYLDVGGYEKRIFMYGEDVELSYRFRAHGWNLRYVPSAVIKHYVDLEDTTLRPNQLSGTAAANILLRYRYGSYIDILAGEAFLAAVARNETDPIRIAAWSEAAQIIKTQRGHFFRKRKLKKGVHFPFHEFDYDIIRPGATVKHVPYKAPEKKKLPLISIVTRTHGKAQHHLENAVASVLSQTYPNIELIIVEDRTDEAREYIESLTTQYGDKIRYYKSTAGGRSACGNHGAKQAKGKFLCWLDNDDMFFADHIETLVRALEQDPKAVCSYALAWDALSKIESHEPVELSYQLPELHCRPYDKERFLTENFIPIQAIIFAKKLFDNYGGFNVDYSQLEDWNLWARYAQIGPFVYTPKVTSLYRTPANEEERQRRYKALDADYENVRISTQNDIIAIKRKNG